MKVGEFNSTYEYAKSVNVVTADWFNMMMWFWMQLTERQHRKMYELMLMQGADETVVNGQKGIKLKHGSVIFERYQ